MSDLFSQLKIKAQSGDSYAQASLGYCYLFGYDTQINHTEAVKWLELSSKDGNPAGEYRLAYCYYNGFGVNVSYEKAVRLYKSAAEKGIVVAMSNLGLCYYLGKGTPQSYEEAVKWYYLAAVSKHEVAQYNLAGCYAKGLGVPKSDTQAFLWYKRSAEKGYSPAKYALSLCYYNGTGTAKSLEDSFNWAYSAAVAGNLDAMRHVGNCYIYGNGITKCEKEALKWYNKGANKGHLGCIYSLSCMYHNAKLYGEAEKLARELDAKNILQAAKIIGSCLEFGRKDYAGALYWYNKSTKQGEDATAEAKRVAAKINPTPTPSTPAFSSGFSSYETYPAGTFTNLGVDSAAAFVNRCLKTDLDLCCSEEERRKVVERYRYNYPDTPLEDYSSFYTDSYSSFDDKSFLDTLNDIM